MENIVFPTVDFLQMLTQIFSGRDDGSEMKKKTDLKKQAEFCIFWWSHPAKT